MITLKHTNHLLTVPFSRLTKGELNSLEEMLQHVTDQIEEMQNKEFYIQLAATRKRIELKATLLSAIKFKLMMASRVVYGWNDSLYGISQLVSQYEKIPGYVNWMSTKTLADKERKALTVLMLNNPLAVYEPVFKLKHSAISANKRLELLLDEMVGRKRPIVKSERHPRAALR